MKGYIIHEEVIRKRNGKIQFQIKLPSTVKMITGVLVVIDTKNTMRNTHGSGATLDQFKGSTWLRIPEKRDVFYASEVFEYHGEISPFFRKPEFGFIHSTQYWISGHRPELFSVDVSVESTMIEGYFEDDSSKQMEGYTLKIYLETQL